MLPYMKLITAVGCAVLVACSTSKSIQKSASVHELALEMVTTFPKQTYEATMASFAQAVIASYEARGGRKSPAEFKRIVLEVVGEEVSYDAIMAVCADFYERHFSAEELRQLTAMRRSAVVQKEINLAPTMMQEVTAQSIALLAARRSQIEAKLKERLASSDKH